MCLEQSLLSSRAWSRTWRIFDLDSETNEEKQEHNFLIRYPMNTNHQKDVKKNSNRILMPACTNIAFRSVVSIGLVNINICELTAASFLSRFSSRPLASFSVVFLILLTFHLAFRLPLAIVNLKGCVEICLVFENLWLMTPN